MNSEKRVSRSKQTEEKARTARIAGGICFVEANDLVCRTKHKKEDRTLPKNICTRKSPCGDDVPLRFVD